MRKILALGLAGALATASVGATTVTAEARSISPAGAAIAGGIFGFALGALATQHYSYAPYAYYPYPGYATYDYYYYAQPAVSPHVAWCAANYRSYNAATDTFIGYDGRIYRCVSPY